MKTEINLTDIAILKKNYKNKKQTESSDNRRNIRIPEGQLDLLHSVYNVLRSC